MQLSLFKHILQSSVYFCFAV